MNKYSTPNVEFIEYHIKQCLYYFKNLKSKFLFHMENKII